MKTFITYSSIVNSPNPFNFVSRSFARFLKLRNTSVLVTVLIFHVSVNTCTAQFTKISDRAQAANGGTPFGTVISDGTYLYGMMSNGGSSNMGVIYKVRPDGSSYSVILNFSGANGAYPNGSLLYDGTYLYGMTFEGGSSNWGVIFKIKPDGSSYTKLLDFTGHAANGSYPYGSLITDGTYLYGVSSELFSSYGTIFKIAKNAPYTYTTIYVFPNDSPSGYLPEGDLYYDGTYLYGMTMWGGTSNMGVIYKLKPDGTSFTKLLDFTGSNGKWAPGSLIADDTYLYGMTVHGGTSDMGVAFRIMKNAPYTYTKLVDFNGAEKGSYPESSLLSSGAYLYGVTTAGGAANYGVVFEMKRDGSQFAKSYEITDQANGVSPYGTLFCDGTYLYGGTSTGGNNAYGTLFKFQPIHTLPIELLSFDAKPSNNTVDLNWVTATETNNDYFTIEKTKDGANFEFVAKVKGAGTSTRTLSYTTNDTDPFSGMSYYRLKQTDYDGKYKYSDLVTVNLDKENTDLDFGVYPNPTTSGNINIHLTSNKNNEVLIVINDVLGREYYSKIIILDNDDLTVKITDGNKLPPGLYTITASSNNKLYSKRLLIR